MSRWLHLTNLNRRMIGCFVLLLLASVSFFRFSDLKLRSQEQSIQIVTAAHDLPSGKSLQPADLDSVTLPRRFAPPGAVQHLDALVGLVTLSSIFAGEPITTPRVAVAPHARRLAAIVPAGQRALTFPLSAVKSGGALLRPQDHVDLLADFEFGERNTSQGYVMTLLRNLQILAINRSIGEEVPKPASGAATTGQRVESPGDGTVTIAVAPEDAQRVVFALEHGVVYLTLHATGEAAAAEPAPTPATAAQVTGLTSLIPRRDYRGR